MSLNAFMARTPRPFPNDLPRRAFRVKDAKALGITRGELKRASVSTLSRGIRLVKVETPGEDEAYFERLLAVLNETPGAVASHLSAARLHGLPIPHKFPIKSTRSHGRLLRYAPWYALHVTRPRGSHSPRRRGVLGYSRDVSQDEIVRVSDIAATSIPRTLLDLATWLRPVELVIVLDHVMSHGERGPRFIKTAKVSRAELEAYVATKSGYPGVKKLRLALSRAVERADSPPETRLRLALEDSGLPLFHVNVPIMDETGAPICWPDLSNHEFKVCVEYEGAHHLTPEQQHLDARRDYAVHAAGWLQVKITKLDMRYPEIAVGKVRSALMKQGWKP